MFSQEQGPSVSSPGIIDSNRGIITWNVGWYGSFDLEVRPVTCEFGADDNDWVTRTIVIGATDGPITSDNSNWSITRMPNSRCWIFYNFITGGEPVRWFVNSPVGLTTDTTYLLQLLFMS